MNSYDHLSSLLRAYFCNEFYEDGISALKRDISANDTFAKRWDRMVVDIQNGELLSGQPLTLIHDKGNQVLDYNTDEEAYNWLELMIQNVEREDGEIICY